MRRAGLRIQFQNLWPRNAVQHYVDAHIAQPACTASHRTAI